MKTNSKKQVSYFKISSKRTITGVMFGPCKTAFNVLLLFMHAVISYVDKSDK